MKKNKIVIATHGDLSKGLKHALSMILGSSADSVETFSLYPGESAGDYAALLESEISKDEQRFLLLTDVRGGSVYSALYQLLRYNNVKLFTGTNLPLVIEVALNPERAWDERGMAELLQSAAEGLGCEDSKSMTAHEDEDF